MEKEAIEQFIDTGIKLKEEQQKHFSDSGVLDLTGNMPASMHGWMSNIKIYVKRNLANHPLYEDFNSVLFHNKNKIQDYDKMMGLLQALSQDTVSLKNMSIVEKPIEKAADQQEVLVNAEESISEEKKVNPIIFISHRSTDKSIADMLLDFFCGTDIPRKAVFCSSLPGNDINQNIPKEVKEALKNSVINIAILSRDYYQSAYCLNEAGVIWYQDNPVIPIALPEIDVSNMYGFLNNEYKLRRLDCDTDISYIYDTIHSAISAQQSKVTVITHETQKLKEHYNQYVETREKTKLGTPTTSLANITTDDERIVLYYILKENVRKISKNSMITWLHKNEIYDVNVDNAFDLLSSFDGGSFVTDTLEFGIEAFRKYSTNAGSVLPELKNCIDKHTKLASDTFIRLWDAGNISLTIGLFIAYIVDERMSSFGDRWMAKGQVESIRQWESKNSLFSTLSDYYGSCLELFKQNNLVYESGWTSYGNPREYTLCHSLQDLLFNHAEPYSEKLEKWKKEDYDDLPF